MKTAQDILKSHTKGMMSEMRIINAMKEYAIEVAREALKNASESADTIEIPDAYGSYIDVVDKQSILNESNIPSI